MQTIFALARVNIFHFFFSVSFALYRHVGVRLKRFLLSLHYYCTPTEWYEEVELRLFSH